jgi:hypothetical protein
MSPSCGAHAHLSGFGSEKVLPVCRGLLAILHGTGGDRFSRSDIGRRPVLVDILPDTTILDAVGSNALARIATVGCMSTRVTARQKFCVFLGDRNDCASYNYLGDPVGLSIGVGLVPHPYGDFARVHRELVGASLVDRNGPDRKAKRQGCQGNRFGFHLLLRC